MKKFATKTLFERTELDEPTPEHIIRVVFESAVDASFDYAVDEELWPIHTGQRVEVPFGRSNKHQQGYCIADDVPKESSFAGRPGTAKLKKVIRVIDKEPLISKDLMSLAEWISRYYVCPLGQVLAAMLPAAVKKGIGVKKEKLLYLADDYSLLTAQIRGRKQKQIIQALESQTALSAESAVSTEDILSKARSSSVPLKRLIENHIIRVVEKTILKALPAIPQEFILKADKVILNKDQQTALDYIDSQIQSNRFGVTVLHGVSDSGKTEVYIRAINTALSQGKAAIVLVPEIALTAQTVQHFSARFENIAVMHSGLTATQRNAQWQSIKSSQANVIIGARSAVFAPAENLGLIIVDEEHEPSYKQETAPRYNARDVAIKRAQLAHAHCVLGSATPSLETWLNCRKHKYFNLVSLPKRVMDLPGPSMKLIDMRGPDPSWRRGNLISPALESELHSVLEKGRQAILLLNRRGYSSIVLCSSCKYALHCPNCDAALRFHKVSLPGRSAMSPRHTVSGRHIQSGYAICHYCLRRTLVPQNCPLCRQPMIMLGIGSQKLTEEVKKKFPGTVVTRVDSDSMQSTNYYEVLHDFAQGKINILAGTQMLAKGLHFPNVTLVGIISAETSLCLPDFRANERTYQLICQAAGRAGRSAKGGKVLIQTFLPDQPVIRFALHQDYNGFIEEELKHRRNCNLPPYWRLAVVELRDMKFEKLSAAVQAMRQQIDRIIQKENLEAVVRGPLEPVISRIQRFHRIQIIIQAPCAQILQQLFTSVRNEKPIRPAVRVAIDIDPVNNIG
ncbi:MAG: primosomal protein N' [Planctomycetota bacterium]